MFDLIVLLQVVAVSVACFALQALCEKLVSIWRASSGPNTFRDEKRELRYPKISAQNGKAHHEKEISEAVRD